MATTQTLAQLQSEVSALNTELQNQGENATKASNIVATSKKLIEALDKLQPHINKAEAAFGGQKEAINQANDLRNKLNKVIAAYS